MSERVTKAELESRYRECPAEGHYQHHKSGDWVYVVGAAINEADSSPLVLYVHDGIQFARPLAEFRERFCRTK